MTVVNSNKQETIIKAINRIIDLETRLGEALMRIDELEKLLTAAQAKIVLDSQNLDVLFARAIRLETDLAVANGEEQDEFTRRYYGR